MTSGDVFIRLWTHETLRVFHDRLVDAEDRKVFRNELLKILNRIFQKKFTHEVYFDQ